MKSLLFSCICSLGLICCNQIKKDGTIKNSKADTTATKAQTASDHNITKLQSDPKEDKLLNLIYNLPEVKERANYVEKQTNGERHLNITIIQTPEEPDDKSYWLKVGEDNGTNFVTHFTFSVNPDTFEVKYYDVINDTLVSLATWRAGIPTE
jgi:hypothetical protein